MGILMPAGIVTMLHTCSSRELGFDIRQEAASRPAGIRSIHVARLILSNDDGGITRLGALLLQRHTTTCLAGMLDTTANQQECRA